MPNPVTFTAPNVFQLQGGSIRVTYSNGSGGSKLHLSYQDAVESLDFEGTQVQVTDTPIGTLVTVVIRRTVDTGGTSFSVLIPVVNLPSGPDQSASVQTEGITTVHRFSVVAMFNRGQTETYQVTPLSGTAEFIPF
jgi:hypothetical protein